MNVGSHLLWGFVATIVLTTLMALSQGLKLTRMNISYMLGTMFTPSRDRARLLGTGLHLVNGWLFSLLYVLAFHTWGRANAVLGGFIGLVHAAFVLTVGLPLLPSLHPRMASEEHGPTVVRQLEPPGFLGLHYGVRTPLAVLLSHLIFGVIVGGFYSF